MNHKTVACHYVYRICLTQDGDNLLLLVNMVNKILYYIKCEGLNKWATCVLKKKGPCSRRLLDLSETFEYTQKEIEFSYIFLDEILKKGETCKICFHFGLPYSDLNVMCALLKFYAT